MRIGTRTYMYPSICKCGFRVLYDDIPQGKVYEVDEDSVRGGFNFICGGCRTQQKDVTVIDARETGGRFAPLPLGIFAVEVPH